MRTYTVIGLAVCTLIVAGWSSRGRAEEPSAEQRRAEQRRADMDAELAKKQQLLELRRSESKLLKHAAMLKSEGRAVALNRKENELLAREKMLSVREAMLKVQERELALNRKENELLALEQKNQRVLKDIEHREASFKNVQVQIVDETSEREVAKRLRAELHKRALEREKKLEAQRKLSLDILSPLEKAKLAWEAEKELEAKKEKERAEAGMEKLRAQRDIRIGQWEYHQEYDDGRGPDMEKFHNLGLQGWELCTATALQTTNRTSYCYFFKRPAIPGEGKSP